MADCTRYLGGFDHLPRRENWILEVLELFGACCETQFLSASTEACDRFGVKTRPCPRRPQLILMMLSARGPSVKHAPADGLDVVCLAKDSK